MRARFGRPARSQAGVAGGRCGRRRTDLASGPGLAASGWSWRVGPGCSGAGRRRAKRATRWRAGPGEQAGASACWAAREGERARATGLGKECGRGLAEALAWARAGLGRGKGNGPSLS